jgi:hypothetical protein
MKEEKSRPIEKQIGMLTELDKYVISALNKGYNKKHLKKILSESGWDDHLIDLAFRKVGNRFSHIN